MGNNKEEIVEKARELAKMIADTDEVEYFKAAEAKINENRKVQDKIKMIKRLQKQAVNLQNYGKFNALRAVEAQIEALEQEVDEIPVVQAFKDTQVDVNELLQMVTHTISNTVTDEIIKSTNGDVLQGKTGSALLNQNKQSINISTSNK